MNRFSGRVGGTSQCSVWWLSTHFRQHPLDNADETYEIVESYNNEMRSFFDSGQCGNVNYLDVYNMTKSLALGQSVPVDDVKKMTHDGVHWGMEVNMVKAQIVLNGLINSNS